MTSLFSYGLNVLSKCADPLSVRFFFFLQFTASRTQPTFPFDVSRMMPYQFKGPYDYEFITGRFKHAICRGLLVYVS